MLDVGQGLSAVVQTGQHTLVFDTGGSYAEHSDMGEAVVLPFLQQQGITQIDTLLISHADNDHIGGAASLAAALPISQTLTSAVDSLPGAVVCQAGQSWRWDDVMFKVLSPPARAFASENDNSCVLQVVGAQHRLLLTGDIEAEAEDWLAEHYADTLQNQVLIAPHHGSKTSSTEAFLRQVSPEWVLIPAGYMNRFGFPHAQVLARYRQMGINWLSTAEQGAIYVRSTHQGLEVDSARQRYQRYWLPPIETAQ